MKKYSQKLLSILTIGLILLFFHNVSVATEPAADMKSNEKILSEYAFPNIEKTVQGDAPQTTTAPEKKTTTVENADKLAVDNNIVLGKYKLLAACFLLLGMMVSLFCILYFVMKTRHSADDIVHASALVLLIFGTIILVVIVNADQQLTAAIGILGAIAGYLFGSLKRGKEEKSEGTPEGTK
jgi:hypothetical protein